MKVTIYTIGKVKERYFLEAEHHYEKQLKNALTIQCVELPDTHIGDRDPQRVKDEEAQTLLKRVSDKDFLIVLDERGEMFSSAKFAQFLDQKQKEGRTSLIFAIGGALGFAEAVRKRANLVLALSPLTFPHQMVRLFLMEQLYRSQAILRGAPYHR
jgi:23S rRNA (pseudouridine1915-N3)-methyltransferase